MTSDVPQNEPPPTQNLRFGAKGDSDVGAKLLSFVAFVDGAAVVLFGVAIMLRADFSLPGLGSLETIVGAVVAAFGALFLGALAYLRERYGSH